jgi:hypothetical protein
MEAMYKLKVENIPGIVAVSDGKSIWKYVIHTLHLLKIHYSTYKYLLFILVKINYIY